MSCPAALLLHQVGRGVSAHAGVAGLSYEAVSVPRCECRAAATGLSLNRMFSTHFKAL